VSSVLTSTTLTAGSGTTPGNTTFTGYSGTYGVGGAAGAVGAGGLVSIVYLTADATGLTITGGTSSTSGSYTVRTFTSSGSLVIA
jgi:hypothetical protein